MKLSLLIPVHNEEANIPHLIPAIDETFAETDDLELELIFVDDGSKDDTHDLLRAISKSDPRVRVIRFSRNFGSHAALLAAFERCTGDAAAYLAADLQDPPETLLEMLAKWCDGASVVWGYREQREDPLGTRLFASIYNSLMRNLVFPEMPSSGLDLCLVDRKVINAIVEMREKNTSIFGLILWSGFPQTFVPFRRRARQRGSSRWTLGRKIKLVVDSFVAFSFFPIRLVTYLGVGFSLLGFGYGVFTIIRALMGLTEVQGWATIVTLVVFLSGIQLLMLGVVAEYLWRTFDESRRRPPYIIRDQIGFPGNDNGKPARR